MPGLLAPAEMPAMSELLPAITDIMGLYDDLLQENCSLPGAWLSESRFQNMARAILLRHGCDPEELDVPDLTHGASLMVNPRFGPVSAEALNEVLFRQAQAPHYHSNDIEYSATSITLSTVGRFAKFFHENNRFYFAQRASDESWKSANAIITLAEFIAGHS